LLRWFADGAAVLDEFARSLGGGWSESGDLEALADTEGAERRPERLVSLGERGGPMDTACGMKELLLEKMNRENVARH